jgi:acyl-CoA synthetase (AMP-forming)/AMP-acid ligase II
MQTFLNPIGRGLRIAGRREALVCGDVRLTFDQLGSRLARISTVLDQLGTRAGDRVAVLAGNSHQYIELYCGIPSAGRAVVPLNTRWADPELVYALDDSGSAVLFCDREPGELADHVGRVVSLPDEYEELVDGSAEGHLGDGVDEDTLAGLFYTGGTTGASKGVMLSHRNLVDNTFHAQFACPMRPDDTYLVVAPLFHAAGTVSVLQSIGLGARQVVLPGAFDPEAALDAIEAEAATVTLVVPTMLAAMLESQAARARDVQSLRLIGHGGSPIALELVRRAAKAFPDAELVHLYGATETAPILTGLNHEEHLVDTARAKSCGQAVLGVELRIADPLGNDLPPGEAGEVLARGANITAGYWQKPEQTAAALVDGWYRTGDVGILDDEGYLFLVDRAKDMIVSGGENVYCTEVEDALYTHAMVLEATVFGIPDEQWGEAVHAVVVPRGTVTEAELIEHCRGQIAGYKVPKSISFQQEALPKSGPGKVLKRELRTPFWEGRARQIN